LNKQKKQRKKYDAVATTVPEVANLTAASAAPAYCETKPTEKLFELLGRKSIDKELDAEFWKNGTGYSPDVLASILITVQKASVYPSDEFIAKLTKTRQI